MEVLSTARLVLRPFTSEDVPRLAVLAGAREIAATTLRIPHPYSEADAAEFVASCREHRASGVSHVFAITQAADHVLCGACGLEVEPAHQRAELGYWIGMPYWGRGYATEAAAAVTLYGLDHLKLHRVFAAHLRGNHASGRVLQKIGMRYEGRLRDHIFKWGKYYDAEAYGILQGDPRTPATA